MTVPCSVRVEGEEFTGFQSVTIELTMDSLYNSFDLQYAGTDDGERYIYKWDTCAVIAEDDPVIEGFVSSTDDEDSEDGVRLSVGGRSKTYDFASFAAVRDPGTWTNATLDTIAADLAAPYGLATFMEGDPGEPFASFSVQQGETAGDTLLRACNKRGRVPYCVGGDLVIARVGSTRAPTKLVRGQSPLLSSATSSNGDELASDYVFRGQVRATDEGFGEVDAEHALTDDGVPRFRPLRVQAEAGSVLDLKQRSELERSIRRGRSRVVTAVVDGWTMADGKVWRPNTLVQFDNPALRVQLELLITTVRLRASHNRAPRAELTMMSPGAYDSAAKLKAVKRGELWISGTF